MNKNPTNYKLFLDIRYMINLLNVIKGLYLGWLQIFPCVLHNRVKPQAIWLKRISLVCIAVGSLRLIVSAVNGFLVIALEPPSCC